MSRVVALHRIVTRRHPVDFFRSHRYRLCDKMRAATRRSASPPVDSRFDKHGVWCQKCSVMPAAMRQSIVAYATEQCDIELNDTTIPAHCAVIKRHRSSLDRAHCSGPVILTEGCPSITYTHHMVRS